MPITYIKPTAPLGAVLRDVTELVNNASDEAHLKAKVVRGGAHKGEIMLYAKTGVKESFKDFFFMTQNTRRAAARAVLLGVSNKLNCIDGVAFDAVQIHHQADPRSLFGKPISLSEPDDVDPSLPTAEGRSLAKSYRQPLRRALAIYQGRFERVYFETPDYADDFVFLPDDELDLLHQGLLQAGCPEQEVVELSDAMRSYVKQCASAYDNRKAHHRLPVQLDNGGQLDRADYLKVERFAHYWLVLARLQASASSKQRAAASPPGAESVAGQLTRLNWYMALNLFVHKNFQRANRGPMRVGEPPVPQPEDLLSMREKVYEKLTFFEAIEERLFMELAENYTRITPQDILIHSIGFLTMALQEQSTEVKLAFIGSTGREFKARMMERLLKNGRIPFRDRLGLFDPKGFTAITQKRSVLGIARYEVFEPMKRAELDMLGKISVFLDVLYAEAAYQISYKMADNGDIAIGKTIYRRGKKLEDDSGFEVHEYAALRRTGRSVRLHPSGKQEDKLVVRAPLPIDREADPEARNRINWQRINRAVQIAHQARAAGELRRIREEDQLRELDTEAGEFPVIDGVTRIGPFIYMMRNRLGDPVLFQRAASYKPMQASPVKAARGEEGAAHGEDTSPARNVRVV